MRRLLLPLSVLVLLLPLPVVSAGTPEEPEMPDKTGDVDPLALLGLKPDEASAASGNVSMFDLRSAYVTGENHNGFWFVVNVVDLDGGLATTPMPTQPPVPPPYPPLVATFDVHFRFNGTDWIARATLEPKHHADTTSTPPVASVWFQTNFTLHKDDLAETYVAPMFGALSAPHEAVLMFVPKEPIGNPGPGDVMDTLYAVSKANKTVMDHAPDATVDPTATGPSDPLGTALAPRTANSYEFGQYPGSGAPPRLELVAEGNTTQWAKTDETIQLPITLNNIGDRDLEVRLGMIAPRGWTAQLDEEVVQLPMGSSKTVTVAATPTIEASRQGFLRLTATNAFETHSLLYTLKHGDEAAQATKGPVANEEPGNGKDTPSLAVPFLVAALVFVAARFRR